MIRTTKFDQPSSAESQCILAIIPLHNIKELPKDWSQYTPHTLWKLSRIFIDFLVSGKPALTYCYPYFLVCGGKWPVCSHTSLISHWLQCALSPGDTHTLSFTHTLSLILRDLLHHSYWDSPCWRLPSGTHTTESSFVHSMWWKYLLLGQFDSIILTLQTHKHLILWSTAPSVPFRTSLSVSLTITESLGC